MALIRWIPCRRLRPQRFVAFLLYLTTIFLGSRLLLTFFAARPHQHPEGEPHFSPSTTTASTTSKKPETKARVERKVNEHQLNHHQKPPIDSHQENKLVVHPAAPKIGSANFIPSRRVVHFDLKGAAPKVAYLVSLFPIIKKLGATSILMEWEDMFPFKEPLADVRHLASYSESEAREILDAANRSALEVIPLLQTFGHLEFILKTPKYRHLREDMRYPQVMCVGLEEAWNLLKEAIDQVAEFHVAYGIPFFHIGADEVFQVGSCASDRALLEKHMGKQRFLLWHISRTARYLRDKYNTRVLAWHDMFVNADSSDLNSYNMTKLVEPVIWNYAEDLNHYLPQTIWMKLKPFPFVWGASAFKGADGPGRYYANPNHYVRNHEAWIQQMNRNHASFQELRGLILTGWSRYDHLAVICEVLPVAFPSLALNLQLISTGGSHNYTELDRMFHCQLRPTVDARNCQFPGARVYELVQELKKTRENLRNNLYEQHEFQGWLSRVAVRFLVSSRWYLEKLLPQVQVQKGQLSRLRSQLQSEMSKHFAPDTVAEFLFEYLDGELEHLEEVVGAGQKIMTKETFPLRPLTGLGGDVKQ